MIEAIDTLVPTYLNKNSPAMNKLCVFIFCSLIAFGCNSSKEITFSEEVSTVYFVRHAEKQSDGTKDPDLTPLGQTRARKLAHILSHANIDKIYSTDYKRTMNTAKPLAEKLGYKINSYDPRNPELLIAELKSNFTKNYLIVGHSNSTPNLINSILARNQYSQIEESDYGNLYILKISKENINTTWLRY